MTLHSHFFFLLRTLFTAGLGKLTFKVSAAQLKLNPQKVSYAHAQTHILKPERAQTHVHLI